MDEGEEVGPWTNGDGFTEAPFANPFPHRDTALFQIGMAAPVSHGETR